MATSSDLSLYFQLKKGEKADLEVVAAAALAWVDALRAAAIAIDPDAELKVEIVDAEDASLTEPSSATPQSSALASKSNLTAIPSSLSRATVSQRLGDFGFPKKKGCQKRFLAP